MNVMITGAGRRIGRALAEAFADRGAGLILHCNSSEGELFELQDSFDRKGVKSYVFKHDFSDTAGIPGFVKKIREKAGNIDLLINSASVFPEDNFMDADEASMIMNMKVNSFAPMFLCREIVRGQDEGAFINILDTKIVEYDADHFSYHLSKRNLYTLTQIMALELAPGFRVNGIAPGPVLAPEGKGDDYLDMRLKETPLQTGGGLDSLISTALFLADNRFITGQVIYVDGGYHLKRRVYGI